MKRGLILALISHWVLVYPTTQLLANDWVHPKSWKANVTKSAQHKWGRVSDILFLKQSNHSWMHLIIPCNKKHQVQLLSWGHWISELTPSSKHAAGRWWCTLWEEYCSDFFLNIENGSRSEESPFDLGEWWMNFYQHNWEQTLYLNVLLGESCCVRASEKLQQLELKYFTYPFIRYSPYIIVEKQNVRQTD